MQVLVSASLRRLNRMSSAERARHVERYDAIPIRVAVIDAEMLDAVRAGCRQVVVLGAGLDTRAYRFDELNGTTVFEVDHPATQAEKRRRSANLGPPKSRLVFVPVDFDSGDLGAALLAAGHNAASPTFWIWEGVVMYLKHEAVATTLDAIKRRSAPGSVLALHYHEPSPTLFVGVIRRRIFSWLGEPLIGNRTRHEMAQLVQRAGLTVKSDHGIVEQASRVGAVAPKGNLGQVSRILMATAP
jgi:methyltransferase (TIGR00027 family)